MRVRKTIALSATAAVLASGVTLGLTGAASASKTPPFTGNAAGSVTCSASAKITFPGGLMWNGVSRGTKRGFRGAPDQRLRAVIDDEQATRWPAAMGFPGGVRVVGGQELDRAPGRSVRACRQTDVRGSGPQEGVAQGVAPD